MAIHEFGALRGAALPATGDDAGGLDGAIRVATRQGPVAIAMLHPGDRILTRDSGYRTLMEIRRVRRTDASPPLAVAAGAIGPGLPERAIRIAPGQAFLATVPDLAPIFATQELCIAARALGALPAPFPAQGLWSLRLDLRDFVLAEGVWVEAFGPDRCGVADAAAALPRPWRALRPALPDAVPPMDRRA